MNNVKKYFLPALIFFCFNFSWAQQKLGERLVNSAKNKSENKVENKSDKTIDKSLDKIEGGLDSLFNKKKDKTDKKGTNSQSTKEKNEEINEDGSGSASGSNMGSGTNTGVKESVKPPTGKYNSKFDFVSGEKVIGYDDFSTTSVGDFPLGWNTNSSAEIVTLDDSGQKWLFMSKDGYFQPDFVKDLPENFTLEFDAYTRYRSNNILNYNFYIFPTQSPKKDLINAYLPDCFQFQWLACNTQASFNITEKGEIVNENRNLSVTDLDCPSANNEPCKVKFSIWRQGTRLRIYINETKILDIPQAFDATQKYNAFKFGSKYMNFSSNDNPDEFMVSNLRYAVGAPDTRSKLIVDGKLVTRGILFNVNSDVIQASSYGTVKEIAEVLKQNPEVKVKIVGHTDSDGDADINLQLSQKRAEAVKNMLVSEFKIDASRMETEGKGEAEPSDPNTTPVGKANNRRVEFLKI